MGPNITDLVILNAKVYLGGTVIEGGVAVDEGKIVAIGKEPNLPQGEREVDAAGCLVLPGLVDVHVHFREPGRTHKEDFHTGSRAAAAGGVTTFVDESNTTPPTTTRETLGEKIKLADGKSLVDFSFSVGLNPGNLEDIPEFASKGVSSFAVFDEMEGPLLDIPDAGTLLEALDAIRSVGGFASLNCRYAGLRTWLTTKVRRAGGKDMASYSEGSPPLTEALGAARNLLLAEESGVDVHLREVSASATVGVLERKKTGRVTAEITPNHLLLTREDAERLGPYAQIPPPLRSKHDAESLMAALNSGLIDIVASDHAPHTDEEKQRGLQDIWDSPPGLPGIETMLPLLMTQVNNGRLSLERLVRATSEAPARAFDLYPRKGVISVGSDADLVIVDPNLEAIIRGETLHSKVHWTPFEGWEVVGLPIMTIVRGEVVYEEGEICGTPGWGSFIPAASKDSP